MKTKEDIESYLLRAELQHTEVTPGMWVIQSAGNVQQVVVKLSPPVLVFRVHIMDAPAKDAEELYKTLLELNATEMMHGAYGLEAGKIVLTDALQLENLDFNEFQATIDDITLAVADHYSRLAKFRGAQAA
jgi:hypothetical protein